MDYTLVILIVAAPLFLMGSIYMMVLKMSEPEKMLRPLAGLSPDRQQILLDYKEWMAAHDFRLLTCFQFGTIQVAVFQQQNEQRFLSFYFHQKISFNFETYFDDLTCLDTSTSGSVGLFPARPGNYKQSFPGASMETTWQRHIEGEQHLQEKFRFVSRPLTQPYQQILLNVMRLHMRYLRSIPFWPFRTLYWYAFNRQRMANRSIAQQYP